MGLLRGEILLEKKLYTYATKRARRYIIRLVAFCLKLLHFSKIFAGGGDERRWREKLQILSVFTTKSKVFKEKNFRF